MNIQFPGNEYISLNSIKPGICYQCIESDNRMFNENEYYLFITDQQDYHYALHLGKNKISFLDGINITKTSDNGVVVFKPISNCVINL